MLGLVAFGAAESAWAAGFEKSVLWSGREAGRGGAAVSSVSGSQSIYFNPAGLAANPDAAVNFSPTFISLDGHIVSTTKKEETDQNFSPIGAVSVSQKITNELGVGVAAYVAGGSKAVYDSVDLSSNAPAVTAFQPRIQTDLSLIEYALGFGYQVAPGFRVGAAWRIVQARGGLATIKKTTNNGVFTYVNLDEAKDTKYDGFRVGFEYQSADDVWGFGASYRNTVDFVAKTSSTVNTGKVVLTASGTQSSAAISDTTLATSLPMSISFGGNYRVADPLRLFLAADFVQYSRNKQLGIGGTLTSAVLGGTVTLPNIPLNWEDMWNVRVGGEYKLSGATLRAGYILTTRVSSKVDSRATISPPGTGHLIVLGAGTSFLNNRLDLDGAVEYAFNSASGAMSTTATGSTTKELLADVSTESNASSIALHTGITYRF